MSKPTKREEILLAALELIAEHGFHGAPMAMISERAGVGSGTIYRYFENKDVLIAELYRELEDRLYEVVMEGYDLERPVRERFIHLGKALLGHFIAKPLDFRYIQQFFNSPYGVALRRSRMHGEEKGRNVYHKLFNDGVSRQIIKDLPVSVLFALAMGPIQAAARDHIFGFLALDQAMILQTVEACWDGVKR